MFLRMKLTLIKPIKSTTSINSQIRFVIKREKIKAHTENKFKSEHF